MPFGWVSHAIQRTTSFLIIITVLKWSGGAILVDGNYPDSQPSILAKLLSDPFSLQPYPEWNATSIPEMST